MDFVFLRVPRVLRAKSSAGQTREGLSLICLPELGARVQVCGGFQCRIDGDQVVELEFVAGLVDERVLVEVLRGGQVSERGAHGEEACVAAGVRGMSEKSEGGGMSRRVEGHRAPLVLGDILFVAAEIGETTGIDMMGQRVEILPIPHAQPVIIGAGQGHFRALAADLELGVPTQGDFLFGRIDRQGQSALFPDLRIRGVF